jgi:hypothetical protein
VCVSQILKASLLDLLHSKSTKVTVQGKFITKVTVQGKFITKVTVQGKFITKVTVQFSIVYFSHSFLS